MLSSAYQESKCYHSLQHSVKLFCTHFTHTYLERNLIITTDNQNFILETEATECELRGICGSCCETRKGHTELEWATQCSRGSRVAFKFKIIGTAVAATAEVFGGGQGASCNAGASSSACFGGSTGGLQC